MATKARFRNEILDMKKRSIKDIPLDELPKLAEELGQKKFVAAQLVDWLYKKCVSSFDEMTSLSKPLRQQLNQKFYVSRLKLAKKQISSDGTQKYAWKLSDGHIIESVLIPSEEYTKASKYEKEKVPRDDWRKRLTLCVSTQVGCAMGCKFCRTADLGFIRNLTQSEIIDQIIDSQREFNGSDKITHSSSRISNVVLMGMGEPLANYDNVMSAVKIMLNSKAFNLSKRHLTLSTSGLVDGIERMAKDDLGIKLALSLNATTDELRSKIMPVNKKYPLAKVFEALKKFALETDAYRITFEYVLLADLNDGVEDAKRLVRLISNVPAKVNLIPFNGFEDAEFKSPDEATVERFAQYLRNKNIQVNIRASRGQDILAACGQLAAKNNAGR